MKSMAGWVGVVAMGVATGQPFWLKVVDVSKQVVIAGCHAAVEKLVRDLLQVPVPHFFRVWANHLIKYTTLGSESEIFGENDNIWTEVQSLW